MAPLPGRKLRIKYDPSGDGTGTAVVIAKAKSESGTFNNEPIDITSKDDSGIKKLLDDIGLKSMDLSCSGILSDTTLMLLASNAGTGQALHWFVLDIDGLGSFEGLFFITSYTPGGNDGAEAATFEVSLTSSGVLAWTAAA